MARLSFKVDSKLFFCFPFGFSFGTTVVLIESGIEGEQLKLGRGHYQNQTQIDTGKSLSEALILASINPLYDNRLFIELQEKYKLSTCCFCFDIQNKLCSQHVLGLYFCIFLVIQ